MEVWRVQNQFGRGPYSLREEWKTKDHGKSPNTPVPKNDKGFTRKDKEHINTRTDVFFGFETEAQLRKWFDPEELEKLDELGFAPVKVKAEKVWSSGTQVVFIPYNPL